MAIFLLVYAGSLTPLIIPYFRQPLFDVDRFLAQTAPICLIRGVVISPLAEKEIGWTIQKRTGPVWLIRYQERTHLLVEFCRKSFHGISKRSRLFTLNAVMLLGGVSSIIILCSAWMIVRLGFPAAPLPDIYPLVAEVSFWLIISYVFGITVWNLCVKPVYVFRGIHNIPMKVDAEGYITAFNVLERAVRYCITGICIIILGAIALSVFPIFMAQFGELRLAIMWAQFSLILVFPY